MVGWAGTCYGQLLVTYVYHHDDILWVDACSQYLQPSQGDETQSRRQCAYTLARRNQPGSEVLRLLCTAWQVKIEYCADAPGMRGTRLTGACSCRVDTRTGVRARFAGIVSVHVLQGCELSLSSAPVVPPPAAACYEQRPVLGLCWLGFVLRLDFLVH